MVSWDWSILPLTLLRTMGMKCLENLRFPLRQGSHNNIGSSAYRLSLLCVFQSHTLIFQYHWEEIDKQVLQHWELKNSAKSAQHTSQDHHLLEKVFFLVSLVCYFQSLMSPFLLLLALLLGWIVTALATSSKFLAGQVLFSARDLRIPSP